MCERLPDFQRYLREPRSLVFFILNPPYDCWFTVFPYSKVWASFGLSVLSHSSRLLPDRESPAATEPSHYATRLFLIVPSHVTTVTNERHCPVRYIHIHPPHPLRYITHAVPNSQAPPSPQNLRRAGANLSTSGLTGPSTQFRTDPSSSSHLLPNQVLQRRSALCCCDTPN